MKKVLSRVSSIALTICMISSLSAPALASYEDFSNFADVPPGYWACSEINEAWADGVVNGTYEGTDKRLYSPENTLTLAQFLVIMLRGYYSGEMHVEDDTDPWYAKAVTIAERHGVLDGVGSSNMNAPATRYQMAHIIYNILRDYDYPMPTDEEIKQTQANIGDWDSIPAEHQQAVSTVYALGILKGVNSRGDYNGNGTVKRSVAAVIYSRIWSGIMESGGTVLCVGKYGDTLRAYSKKNGEVRPRMIVPSEEAPSLPAGTYNTVKEICSTQPIETQVALKLRYDLRGVTKAESVNDAIGAEKSDEYPTMGNTDTPNRNGYYTNCTLDLSGCELDYDVLPIWNKYRNEWRVSPIGDAAWVLTDQLEEQAMACAKFERPVQASSIEEAMQKLNDSGWFGFANGISQKYFCLAHYTDPSGRTFYGISYADNESNPGGIPGYDADNYGIE